MAEMGGALPEEGGYVTWVRRAFGPFWGFQVGWWSWLNSFVDVAVYPALFADYLRFWRPEMTAVERWVIALGFVWLLTALNLTGVRITGWGAVALAVGALAPIVASSPAWPLRGPTRPMVALRRAGAGAHERARPRHRRHDVELLGLGHAEHGAGRNPAAGDGLSVARCGGRCPSSRSRISCPSRPRCRRRETGSDGRRGSGRWPPPSWAAHGSRTRWWRARSRHRRGSFSLSCSPIPGCPMPSPCRGSCRAGSPPSTRGPACRGRPCSCRAPCYSLFALASFKELIVLNVWLYSLTLLLELAAFVALRLREPALARPWRVGGGALGLWLTAALPVGRGAPRHGDGGLEEHGGRRRHRAHRPRGVVVAGATRVTFVAPRAASRAAASSALARGAIGARLRPSPLAARQTSAR